jgi:hypothetical protein
MAKISEQNVRRKVWFTLQGHFASRSKPFRRPTDLSHFVHCCVGKARLRTTKPPLCRLALNKMASNLSVVIYEFTTTISLFASWFHSYVSYWPNSVLANRGSCVYQAAESPRALTSDA